jgi:hypothetical protein
MSSFICSHTVKGEFRSAQVLLTNKYPKDWKKITARHENALAGCVKDAELDTASFIPVSVAEWFPRKSSSA